MWFHKEAVGPLKLREVLTIAKNLNLSFQISNVAPCLQMSPVHNIPLCVRSIDVISDGRQVESDISPAGQI